MPTSLDFADHIAAIEAAGLRLASLAEESGEGVRVPTCPGWDVRALLSHQSMVHRWATAHVTGTDATAVPNETEINRSVADIQDYYTAGLMELLSALRAASPDVEAMTFLNDAPKPREFWARRQAHETTVHMVDALAAKVGRMPTAIEAAIDRDLAVDGIDELLAGFFTRGRSKLFAGEAYSMLVAPQDSDRRWHVDVAETLTVSAEPGQPPRLTISGAAASVYLALWNRSNELSLQGDEALMERWRSTQKVRWG